MEVIIVVTEGIVMEEATKNLGIDNNSNIVINLDILKLFIKIIR